MTVYHDRRYPRRLESIATICGCHSLRRQHFLLSYLKTLSVGPAGLDCDLPRVGITLSRQMKGTLYKTQSK